jgi:Domain of unknown function (DUF5666)
MRIRPAAAALTAVAAGAALVPAGATARGGDDDDGPQFEGRVVRVDRANDRFRIRDHESGSHRVYVTSRTRYERVNGLRGLRRGMRIEVDIRRKNGRWIATEVERDRPGDDRRGRGGDDRNDDD